jgi:hypothetical protein
VPEDALEVVDHRDDADLLPDLELLRFAQPAHLVRIERGSPNSHIDERLVHHLLELRDRRHHAPPCRCLSIALTDFANVPGSCAHRDPFLDENARRAI